MTGPGGRILPLGEVQLPGAHNTSNVLAAVAVGLLFGISPDAIRACSCRLHRRRASPRNGRHQRRHPLRQRLAGHAAGRRHSGAAQLRAADRADCRWPQQERAARRSRARSCPSRRGCRADRRDRRRDGRGICPGRRRPRRTRDDPRHRRSTGPARLPPSSTAAQPGATATVLLSPAAASFDMFTDYAERGRAFKQAVRELDPMTRELRGPQRLRHEPDWLLLVSVDRPRRAGHPDGLLELGRAVGDQRATIPSPSSRRRPPGPCSA